MEDKFIPEEKITRRVDIYTEIVQDYGSRTNCLMFYDKIAQRILDCGYDEQDDKLTHVMLEENERIVGIKSCIMNDRPAVHLDMRLIIAKLV